MDGPVGVQPCRWACGHAAVQMGVQPCGHADADGCKQKEKRKKRKRKNLLIGSERADGRVDVWACGCANGHAEVDAVKKRKKKTHWCSERVDGRVDVLRMGMRGCACGRM